MASYDRRCRKLLSVSSNTDLRVVICYYICDLSRSVPKGGKYADNHDDFNTANRILPRWLGLASYPLTCSETAGSIEATSLREST